MQNTTFQVNNIVKRISEVSPMLDAKVQALLEKGLNKVMKDLTALAKAAKIKVEDLLDVVEEEVEGEKQEIVEEEGIEPEKHPEPDGDEGVPGPGDMDEDNLDIEKIKPIFGKLTPEDKEYLRKRREMNKKPGFDKLKGYFDKLNDEDFNKLYM